MPPPAFTIRDDINRHRVAYLGLLVAFLFWGFVDVRVRARRDPEQTFVHMTDLTVYTEAGAAFFDGREPYRVTNDRGWSYLYPPLFAILLAPLQPLDSTVQALTWYWISLAMAFGCYWELRKLVDVLVGEVRSATGRDLTVPRWAWWAALGAALLPALNCLQRGQVGVLKLYLLLLGLRLLLARCSLRAWLLGGIVLAAPIALKLTPALPVGCLLCLLAVRGWCRHEADAGMSWRQAWTATLGVVAGCVLFLLLVPAALIGWSANLGHLDTWYHDVVANVNDVRAVDFGHDVASIRNQSLMNAVYRGGNWLVYQLYAWPDDTLVDTTDTAYGSMPMDEPIVNHMLHAIRLVTLAALMLLAWRVTVAGDAWGMASVFGLAAVASLIVSPVSRGHYFMLMIPAVLLLPAWFEWRRLHRQARWAAFAPVALSWMHYVLLDWTGRMGVLGIGTTVWFFLIVVWMHRAVQSGVVDAASMRAAGDRVERPLCDDHRPHHPPNWATLTQATERA
jgi:hypothetical protein